MVFSGITAPTRVARGGLFQGKRIDVTTDDNVLFMLDGGQATFATLDGTFNVNAEGTQDRDFRTHGHDQHP